MAFKENVDPTAAIRAILDSYPFSVGLFRELLQNSDDALASKQIFILDHRIHPTSSLYDPKLAGKQGPALLAYNDASFSDEDWEALKNIYRSSKKTDTSKIGKYGVGFRSCYHVTDGPQILSGTSLAILDPLHEFSSEGGVEFDFRQSSQYVDQLASFDSLLPRFSQGPGSIIRLPLRAVPGNIGPKPVSLAEIQQLLMEFIDKEIRITLLFLERVQSIEVLEIDVHGKCSVLVLSEVSRSPKVDQAGSAVYTCTVKTRIKSSTPTTERWHIHHTSFPQSDVISRLSQRVGCDPNGVLSTHKLQPDVGIATPLSNLTQEASSGRLYTYLPLPLPTGFPVHIHSLFALSQSRQNLRNHEERGIVRGSADSILVEWNQLLFDVYIPQAWMSFLTTLVKNDHLSDIFRVWPPAQGNQNGDAGYWKDLPAKLLECIIKARACLWPVVAPHNELPCEWLDHQSVVVAAREKPDLEILQALATFGCKITRVPTYIYELLGDRVVRLTPKVAHDILLQHVPKLELHSNSPNLPVITQYLISDGDLSNLVGVPLVLLANGRRISPDWSGSSKIYTMFEKNESEIFGACDDESIALHLLDESLATILRTRGPTVLNVRPLNPETIVRYLKTDHNPLGLESEMNSVSYDTVEWLSKFWTWMHTWHLKDQLYPRISELHLLPAVNGLRKTSSSIYTKLGVHPRLTSAFTMLGISFFNPDFSALVQKVVGSFRRLNDLSDISVLLDALDFDHISTVRLGQGAAHTLLRHFDHSSNNLLTFERQQKLKKIPIFPLLQTGSRHPTIVWGSIPDGTQVRSVIMESLWILPVVHGTVFLDGSLAGSSFLNVLNNPYVPLSVYAILLLALEHFASQSVQTKVAFVEYMAEPRNSIPPDVLHVLSQKRFVLVTDGSLQAPEHVIDPQSDIAPLFLPHDNRFPQMADDQDQLIKGLHLLRVMQGTLTANIVMERIRFISSATPHDGPDIIALSRRLLELLCTSGFNCAGLRIDHKLKWLPTKRGLLDAESCRDKNQSELFDQVLAAVEPGIVISHSLKVALGWDKPLRFQVLTDQLLRVLNLPCGEACKRIWILIKELSRRDLLEDDFHYLRKIIADKPWIPVSGEKLADTLHAVFSGASPSVGFYDISFLSFGQAQQREFLSRMGCPEKPLLSTIIQDLKALQKKTPTNAIARKAILLLKLLPPDLSEEQCREVLVPDSENHLLSIDSVRYNDIGVEPCPTSNDVHIAHPALNGDLATMLHIKPFGLQFAIFNDMGEKLITTIRNKLKDYTAKQLLTEFVANAADAGATELCILIDEYPNSGEKNMSRAMDKFQACPSLVIYNNGTFSENDFAAICNIGVGSKQERNDSIGQFGYGALTMFHFSEVVTIVSGDWVVFLNPSQDPLGHHAVRYTLDHMNRYYPDQLASLNGFFQFTQSSSVYNGTIFRLPLRNPSHICGNSISKNTWMARTIEDDVVRPFLQAAHEFLLFTKLQVIKFLHRDTVGTTSKEQIISANRQGKHVDGRYCSKIVEISLPQAASVKIQKWNVVSTAVSREEFSDHSSISEAYRLRSPIVTGLAARLDSPDLTPRGEFKFFSTLPLPVSIALPVHITAPFILSSDRRQIRFDVYDTVESKYNQWLLESVIPPLYNFLLATLLSHAGHNKLWWPGHVEEGSVSKILVSSFYQVHLRGTEFRVFLPKYAMQPVRPLLPKEAIILDPGSPIVLKKVLKILKPHRLISLPARFRWRALQNTMIEPVTPLFIKSEVLRYSGNLAAQLTWEELHEFLVFIFKNDVRNLIDLPLLPLADGTFGMFKERSCNAAMYFVWEPRQSSDPLFLQNHLVHPEFHDIVNLDLNLNIRPLTVPDIQQLIQEIVPQGDERSEVKQSEQEWIDRFWSEYPFLDLDDNCRLDCISSFPFVQTVQQGRYVSISRCRDQSLILSSFGQDLRLWKCLAELGLTVVDRYSENLPPALRKILQSTDRGFSEFQFNDVLSTLKSSTGLSIAQRFQHLNTDDHGFIARWARLQISKTPPDELLPIARCLPIWPSIHLDELLFLPATDVAMLPVDVTANMVKPFIKTPVTQFSVNLKHLNVDPMTWPDFFNTLYFPNGKLPSLDIQKYHTLLKTVLNCRDISWVLVPNSNGMMCRSDTLYARNPLFLAAFGYVSERLVATAVRDLEPRLIEKFGLKCESQLDLEMFRECASAIDVLGGLSTVRVERAKVIFQTYCHDLPPRVAFELPLREWDSLKFIPRITRRLRRGYTDVSAYVRNRDLPDVVAPKNIVLPKYEAIAWTQRVLSAADPSQCRMMTVNPSFGCPTVQEVVQHLCILVNELSRDFPGNPAVLEDLQKTYMWLDQSSDACTPMIQYRAQKLFLNVADPKTMIWEWHSANDLLLGAKRTIGNFHPVQTFLLSFKNLLIVSGVKQLTDATLPERTSVSGPELSLESMRSVFCSMREQRQLTDVVFIPDTEDSEICAHRAYLATCSDYFNHLFTGPYKEALTASNDSPVEVRVGHSSRCVEIVLDYLYKGVDMIPADLLDLLEVMELSNYWCIASLHKTVQYDIIRLVDPQTIAIIETRAERAAASDVVESCKKYRENNRTIMEHVVNHKDGD